MYVVWQGLYYTENDYEQQVPISCAIETDKRQKKTTQSLSVGTIFTNHVNPPLMSWTIFTNHVYSPLMSRRTRCI